MDEMSRDDCHLKIIYIFYEIERQLAENTIISYKKDLTDYTQYF